MESAQAFRATACQSCPTPPGGDHAILVVFILSLREL